MNVADTHAYRYIYLSCYFKKIFIYLVGQLLTTAHRLFLASCRTLWQCRDALVVAHGLQSVWAPAAAEQAL